MWTAAGAAAGALVGVVVTNRSGKGRKILRRVGGVLRAVDAWARENAATIAAVTGADDDDELEELVDDDMDDEQEDVVDSALDDDAEEEDAPDDEDGDGVEEGDEEEEGDADDGEEHIDERVLSAFEQDPLLAHRDVVIDEPEPGTIVLSGRVPSAADVKHASTIAGGVPGVERVENRLRVRPPRRRSASATAPNV